MGELGAEFLVDDEAAAVVGFDADVLETETGCVGAAADGDEDDVGFELGGKLVGEGEGGTSENLRLPPCHPWRPRRGA